MSNRIVVAAELKSQTGDNRLCLRYTETDNGSDFHSLSLERRTPAGWEPTATITEEQFQGNHPHLRWVADIHSFTPSTGMAIIQVGEGDRPWRELRATMFYYSWRRWDVLQNLEVARLKDCESPFDPL